MDTNFLSRRNFLKNTALSGAMVTTASVEGISSAFSNGSAKKLPREVWIASISQMEIKTDSFKKMMAELEKIINNVLVYKPDIICLPEVFATSNINQKYQLSEKLELSLIATANLKKIASENQCNIVCPVYTSQENMIYNSAVVIDRRGNVLGKYHKMHITEGEANKGLSFGNSNQPVFKLDFGTIGIQICFDMMWDNGWKSLQEQGAEIVFWPSAFAGGRMVNTKAWQHKYVVVSSTRKNTSKICDISGETIAQTGIWDKNFIVAPVNLEKTFLHTWPYVRKFNDIRKKYGRKIQITNFDEEEWSIIESLSHDILIKDVLKEFELKTYDEHLKAAEDTLLKTK